MNKKGEIIRIFLHGFFLVSANLFAVMAAFVLVKMLSIPADRVVQGSIALVLNIGVYILVFKILSGVQKELIVIDSFAMLATVLLISLALLPTLFYPLHYLTQGSWSSFENLLATWPYQIIVNGLCLVLNYFILTKKDSK